MAFYSSCAESVAASRRSLPRSPPKDLPRNLPKDLSRNLPKGLPGSLPKGLPRRLSPRGLPRRLSPRGLPKDLPKGLYRSSPKMYIITERTPRRLGHSTPATPLLCMPKHGPLCKYGGGPGNLTPNCWRIMAHHVLLYLMMSCICPSRIYMVRCDVWLGCPLTG